MTIQLKILFDINYFFLNSFFIFNIDNFFLFKFFYKNKFKNANLVIFQKIEMIIKIFFFNYFYYNLYIYSQNKKINETSEKFKISQKK